MLATPRPRSTFSNAQIAEYFYSPCRDQYDESVPEYFRCRCEKVRKQTSRNGFTKLMQHVHSEHPTFQEEMLADTTAQIGSVAHDARRTAMNHFGWLEWIVKANLLLMFCENAYTSLEPISVETLRALLEGVTRSVEAAVAAELPDAFGIMFDGWAHSSEHFVAVFAYYEGNGIAKSVLLSMAPVINEPDEDLSAHTHRDVLAEMLERDFGKDLSCCKYLVGDNCSMNRRLATIMQVPLVGCASHRLYRAVQQHLAQNEDDLAAVQALMAKLRTIKQSTKLRFKTTLWPAIRQDTHWGSTFSMVHRYFALLEFLDLDDEELMDLLPPPACNRRLKKLYADLKDFESVSKAFKEEREPTGRAGLGCVRVLKGNGARLTASKKWALRPFLQVDPAPDNNREEAETHSLVQRLEKRCRLGAREARYCLVGSIPATSNKVERFFSVARATLGHERNGLQPIALEMVLFLRENSRFWDGSTVDQLL
ncbi:hypothetical protein F442_06809 [Phytophthora nicotianae P10297]|uniref:HAT C-terminal dimerisation domain-containing protein n=1 Tax=Phytophthora nicotianae P10297 TaxID=1317064 RepID=W2ZLG1_PHYNI|nr:hypothetical protein F442_06809 [Phytophthora nicotianae P10297]